MQCPYADGRERSAAMFRARAGGEQSTYVTSLLEALGDA
jgi:hypothetical protein